MKRSLLMGLALAMVATLTGIPATATSHASCADDSAYEGGVHPGGDWRFYGHDRSNTRTQPNEDVLTPGAASTLAPEWMVDSNSLTADTETEGGDITATPTVADGCVYVGTNRGWVFALNADTGELVWRHRTVDRDGKTTAINATAAVVDGVVYLPVDRAAQDLDQEPYVLALDQATGAELWRMVVDEDQVGSNFFGSVMVWDDLVLVGISGLAEVEEDDIRNAFQGAYAIIDTRKDLNDPEDSLTIGWVNPPELWEEGYSGGTIWSTPSVDPETGQSYWGTGNPFDEEQEHNNTNAVIRVDLNRTLPDGVTPNPDFGKIMATYKGNVEQYFSALEVAPCVPLPDFVGGFVEATGCAEFDLDIGASPNIFTDSDGRKLIGVGQKSGVYHAFDPMTLEGEWQTLVGPPGEFGGIVGSTAYDGQKIYGPITIPGYVWSIDKDGGEVEWMQAQGDLVHWGNAATVANGVMYTSDFKGFLNAYEAETGLPLLQRPMWLDVNLGDAAITWAGVSVARNRLYASIGIDGEGYGIPQLPNGYVIAYSPNPALADAAAALDAAIGTAAPVIDEATPGVLVPPLPNLGDDDDDE